MTGRGPEGGLVVDAKSTTNSNSEWDITRLRYGYVEFAILRLGPLFVSYVRKDGPAWTVRKRWKRADLPELLQVGVNGSADFPLSDSMSSARFNALQPPANRDPDLIARFDYVRFQRPVLTKAVRKNIADKGPGSLSDEELPSLIVHQPLR